MGGPPPSPATADTGARLRFRGSAGRVQKRLGTTWVALHGNGMVWFGSAALRLGLAGEHADALTSGPWPRAVGFAMILLAGVALIVTGVLDDHRIRTGRHRLG